MDPTVRIDLEGPNGSAPVTAERPTVFGRGGDLPVDVVVHFSDTVVSRIAGQVSRSGSELRVLNAGKTMLRLVDNASGLSMPLESRRQVAPGWRNFSIFVPGGARASYELRVITRTLPGTIEPDIDIAAPVSGVATEVGLPPNLRKDTNQFYVLVALAEPTLRGRRPPYIPTDAEIRERLSFLRTSNASRALVVRDNIEAVAKKLGIDSHSVKSDAELSARVVERAIDLRSVVVADLGILPPPTRE